MDSDRQPTRWQQLAGPDPGARYSARFAEFAASGEDIHGEARFCTNLVSPPARVMDAGCGTGRVAIRLAELGYRCVGVDLDGSMLHQARTEAPELDWRLADLADFQDPGRFELVVVAGNVIPLLAPGRLPATMANLAGHLVDGALLVTGFGLDSAHLPRNCPVTPLADYDAAAEAAGLRLVARHSGWDASSEPITGYAVSVHQLVSVPHAG